MGDFETFLEAEGFQADACESCIDPDFYRLADRLWMQLSERDREIERLKADYENMSEAAQIHMEARGSLFALMSASQAREREAVERAERAEHNWHWVFETLGIPKEADGSLDLDKAQPVLSALADARKALVTAWAAMCERRGYADAWEWKYGTTWDEEDAEVRAALAPEQKGE